MTTLTREPFTLASPKKAMPNTSVSDGIQPESRLTLRVGLIALATLNALVGCSLSTEASLAHGEKTVLAEHHTTAASRNRAGPFRRAMSAGVGTAGVDLRVGFDRGDQFCGGDARIVG
jgi:hypothetical protein